jgi:hypothetical protein
MRMRNELTVRGEPSEVAKLVERIESAEPDGWRRHREIEGRLWRPPGAEPSTYCFATPIGSGWPAAYLLLERSVSRGLEVSNIIPVDREPLTDDQYNRILDRFQEEFLGPIADGTGVEAKVQPFRVKLEKILSPDSMDAFQGFCRGVGKGVLGPVDRRRWSHFVTQVYIDGTTLDSEELDWSLREAGLDEAQRRQLIERYEEGLSMLVHYDQSRVG